MRRADNSGRQPNAQVCCACMFWTNSHLHAVSTLDRRPIGNLHSTHSAFAIPHIVVSTRVYAACNLPRSFAANVPQRLRRTHSAPPSPPARSSNATGAAHDNDKSPGCPFQRLRRPVAVQQVDTTDDLQPVDDPDDLPARLQQQVRGGGSGGVC